MLAKQHDDGQHSDVELSITPVDNELGVITHFIGVLTDVTAAYQRTRHLEHELTHDPLTGLANRKLLWERLEQALLEAQRNKSLVVVVLADLNGFKQVNESWGHEAGDAVLQALARRLAESARESDTVARLSADEFVLVLADQPSLRYAMRMIDRVHTRVARPVPFERAELQVAASIGVAVYPHDGGNTFDLVRCADIAMYHAKAAGSSKASFISPEMKSTTDSRHRLKSKMRSGRVAGVAQHGAARLLEGFSINDAMSEHRALRASVLRLWTDREPDHPDRRSDEITRFNEAVDQALSESLERFSADRERNTRLFDALLSSSPDLNVIAAPDGRLIYVNKALASMYEMAASQMVGQNLFVLASPVAGGLHSHVNAVLLTGSPYRGEMVYAITDVRSLCYEYLLVPVIDEQRRVEAVAGTARDITERKPNEERVRRRANYDSLTALPNRSLLLDRLDHEIKHASRTGLPLALLFIDLDGFKEVNDQLGHAAGDELLRQAARRINGCVRDTDTVARIGGDEFTVILSDVTQESHIDVIAREMLDALSAPFPLGPHNVTISGSNGIAPCPQDSIVPDTLVRNADLAMYVAKHAGRNAYRHFTAQMHPDAPSS